MAKSWPKAVRELGAKLSERWNSIRLSSAVLDEHFDARLSAPAPAQILACWAEAAWWCSLLLFAAGAKIAVASAPSDEALLFSDCALVSSALFCLLILLRSEGPRELRFASFLLGAASASLASIAVFARLA